MNPLFRLVVPLKSRNFLLLWIGQTISSLGDAAQVVALAWLVLDLTHSSLAVSGALLSIILPRVALVLVGGIVTDRQHARPVMLWSDIVRAGAIGMIAMLGFIRVLPLPLLYGFLIVYGAAGGFFFPAFSSVIPQLVPNDELQAANSLKAFTPQLTIVLVAPLTAGFISLVGPLPAIAFNAASFGIAALFTAQLPAMRYQPMITREATPSLLHEARLGLTYVGTQTWLLSLLGMNSLANFAVAGLFSIGLPLLARNNPSVGLQGLGLLLAGSGVGSIAGLFLAGLLPRFKRRGLLLSYITLCQAPLYGGIALIPLPVGMIALAIAGLLNGVDGVAYTGLVQERTPKELLGRVMGIVTLANIGLQPLSQLVVGIAGTIFNIRLLFILVGILVLLSSLIGLLTSPLRDVD